jgi:hypothetical protein
VNRAAWALLRSAVLKVDPSAAIPQIGTQVYV